MKAGLKAVITKVGTIENGKPMGFVFDCCGVVPGIEIKSDGQVLYGGHAVDELVCLCALPRESLEVER